MAVWSAPCSPCIFPESVLVVLVVPVLPAGVVSHRTDSLQRRIHDCHSSDGVLRDAGHPSQNLTQLAAACSSALRGSSHRCPSQMFDARASPAVGCPACSPSSLTCCCSPATGARSHPACLDAFAPVPSSAKR